MKVTIEIDATPQEIRAMLGFPDFEPIQQEIMEKSRERILEAIETKDPTQLMMQFMPTATGEQLKSMESMQASFWEALSNSMGFPGDSTEKKK